MSEFDDLETLESEWHSKKKNFLTVLHQRGEAVRKSGKEKNCGKLRKIANLNFSPPCWGGGDEATDAELACSPVSQAYGHRRMLP
jgi:hypothetical protein